MDGPTKLSNYPWVVVRVECSMCRRKGCYRLARLAARYGPELSLDRLLSVLAHDCPWWNERPRKYEVRCGAFYADLDRYLPPIDDPREAGMPIYREREPSRESREAYERYTAAPRIEKNPEPVPAERRLSNWPKPLVRSLCMLCGKGEEFDKDTLMALGDKTLTDLRAWLTRKCPNKDNPDKLKRCRPDLY